MNVTIARVERNRAAAIKGVEMVRDAGRVWDAINRRWVAGRVVGKTRVERGLTGWRAEAAFEVAA